MFREFHAGHHIRDVSQSFWGDIRPSEVVKGQLIIHNTHILHKAKKGQELLQTYTTTHVSKLFLDPLQGFACFATGSSEAQNHLGKVQFGDHSSGNHKSEYIPKFLNLQTTFTWNPLTGSRTSLLYMACHLQLLMDVNNNYYLLQTFSWLDVTTDSFHLIMSTHISGGKLNKYLECPGTLIVRRSSTCGWLPMSR